MGTNIYIDIECMYIVWSIIIFNTFILHSIKMTQNKILWNILRNTLGIIKINSFEKLTCMNKTF